MASKIIKTKKQLSINNEFCNQNHSFKTKTKSYKKEFESGRQIHCNARYVKTSVLKMFKCD